MIKSKLEAELLSLSTKIDMLKARVAHIEVSLKVADMKQKYSVGDRIVIGTTYGEDIIREIVQMPESSGGVLFLVKDPDTGVIEQMSIDHIIIKKL